MKDRGVELVGGPPWTTESLVALSSVSVGKEGEGGRGKEEAKELERDRSCRENLLTYRYKTQK